MNSAFSEISPQDTGGSGKQSLPASAAVPGVRARVAPGCSLDQPGEAIGPAFRMANALLDIGQAGVSQAQQRSARLFDRADLDQTRPRRHHLAAVPAEAVRQAVHRHHLAEGAAREASAGRGMDLPALLAWLVDESGASPGPDRFLAELGGRLLDGLPLAGGALTLAVPHPALGFAGGPLSQAGLGWQAGLARCRRTRSARRRMGPVLGWAGTQLFGPAVAGRLL